MIKQHDDKFKLVLPINVISNILLLLKTLLHTTDSIS